jgi:outer membrane receptor protein involved in Fe transport
MSISSILRRTLAAIVVSTIMFSIPAVGQTFYGSIVGTVTDPSGAALPGADVTLTNVSTGVQSHAATGASGEYQFFNLTPSQYKVDITAAGFKRYTRTSVTVVVDQATRIDASMPVGATNQEVVVTAQSPILQSENASVGTTISGSAVDNLPLNGRNVLNLASLSPAIVPQGGTAGPLTGQNVFAAGNYQIGGGNGNQGSTLIDGAPINLNYANQTSLVPTQDSVQEFRVETNNLTAEYGMFTGGVINITTKSGTNAYHGTLYEYLRNTHLNANPYAFAPGAGKQPFHQNQFGGSIGGPIKKDKLFFFGNYEGYRNHQGQQYTETVPTAAELSGDFSNYRDASGNVIPVYNPLTTCGYNGNAACTAAQLAGTVPTRAQFPGNKIPTSAMDPVAQKLINFPEFGNPTSAGQAFTQLNNFATFAVTGGHYDQYDVRLDYAMSQKQHIFGRWIKWKSQNVGANPYGNGLIAGDPISPEGFDNNSIVLGDTFLFSPKTIFDMRVSYLRWHYQRTPGFLGIDPSTLGFPSYMSSSSLSALQGFSPASTVPTLSFSNPAYEVFGTGLIVSTNNNVILAPTFTRVVGRHTLKFGADLRSLNWEFFQSNNPSGVFSFDNIFTSQNALSPGNTGNSLASMELGDMGVGSGAGTNLQISPVVTQITRYQGYYANDTWQASDKLTVTLGLRYEIPGVFIEKHNNFSYFDANSVNPVFAGLNVNGGPVMGSYGLVATPGHPQRGARYEHFTDFSPRFGLAYRLNEGTVLRAGFGVFFLPSDLLEGEGPNGSAVNYLTNQVVYTTNSSQTPTNHLANPFPGGPLGAPLRSANFQNVLLGGTGAALQPSEANAYAQQFNVGVQHQFRDGVAVDVAYGGSHSQHLPRLVNINTLPDQYLSLGNALLTQVPNPFYPKISQGVLSAATVPYEYTLLPYPAYGNIGDPGQYQGVSNYSSLQVKLEKRFHAGGNVLGAYTFSKLLTDTEDWTSGWLDPTGSAGYQDYNNLAAEYSNSSFDNRQRLTAGYVYPLPFGRGQQYFSGVGRLASGFVSGWAINGLTTFQLGYPMGLTATPNLTYSLGGGLRPNVVPGCNPKQGFGGAVTAHLQEAFNTSCFTVPAPFTYGDAPRTFGNLRGHGIDNSDVALAKTTGIKESVSIELRAEAYNLFNRVQFGNPGTVVTTAPNTLYGQINTQLNTPRILQLGARLKF